jgi:hypothetical protein
LDENEDKEMTVSGVNKRGRSGKGMGELAGE